MKNSPLARLLRELFFRIAFDEKQSSGASDARDLPSQSVWWNKSRPLARLIREIFFRRAFQEKSYPLARLRREIC
jgi:hypothetical protein